MGRGGGGAPTRCLQLFLLALLALPTSPEARGSEASEVEEPLAACRAESARLAARVTELEHQLVEAEARAARGAGHLRGAAARGPRSGALQAAEMLEPYGTRGFYRQAFFAFLCVVLAALAAGLTMGLVSIEPMEMKIIVNTEEKDMWHEKDKQKLKEDQAAAKKVLPLIVDHHRLLVTLLLMNSIANEALPLFLDRIVPSWMAVGLSVSLVLMFGEIIPSAIFTGSEQLKIAAKFAPLVSFFRVLLTPVAWPIAKILDNLLGEDHKGRYNFAELRAIVGIHANLRSEEPHAAIFKHHDDMGLGIITTELPHNFTEETVVIFTDAPGVPAKSTKLRSDGTLYYVKPCAPLHGRDQACTFKLYTTQSRRRADLVTFVDGELMSGAFVVQERDEIKIMHGVMKLTHMAAIDGIKPLSEVHMLEWRAELTREMMLEILELGHSRLPVYCDNQHNVRGFILAKKLIIISPEDHKRVEDLDIMEMVVVRPDIPMLDLLNKFQSDRCHIALVTSAPDRVKRCWAEKTVIPPDVHMMGIITLEDIIEQLIQEEIWDEHDPSDIVAGQVSGPLTLKKATPYDEKVSSPRSPYKRTARRLGTGGTEGLPVREHSRGLGGHLHEPLLKDREDEDEEEG